MKPFILILVALSLSSCASIGRIKFEGDLTAIGLPAHFSYDSGKNPIRSNK